MRIGVLAVQGDFSLHARILENLNCDAVEVRACSQLNNLDGLILPGGESTTFQILLGDSGLGEALRQVIRSGMPVWGTCAGAILLGYGEERLQPRLNVIDIEVVRNSYGRQVDSFITPLSIAGFDGDFPGVFIRAPRFRKIGSQVEVLAYHGNDPVMAQQGRILVTSFHPELASDDRIHKYFINRFCSGMIEDTRRAV